MPRNASGVYTLPAGNPVVPGTTIDAAWANDTLEDLANEVTNSLSRTGAGGMLAPFRLADGTITAPGVAWLNETNSGLYRSGAGSTWMSILGVNVAQFSTVGLTIPFGKALTAQGNASVSGTFGVTGATTLSSTLAVTGAITATGGVVGNVTGNVTAASGTSSFNDVSISGSLDMVAGSSATITGLNNPVNASDAANKGYVDTQDALKLSLTGGTMSGNIAMGGNLVTGMGAPSAGGDATNKTYVDGQVATRLPLAGGTMTGYINMNGYDIVGLSTPTDPAMAANKAYVDSMAQGIDAKASCKIATETNTTLSGGQIIQGVALVTGDRVLVKSQTSAAENGIYTVASGVWPRAADANTWDEMIAAYTFIEEGTNANNGYVCTVTAGGTLGTTPVTWSQFSGAGQITAGAGMYKSGNTLNVGTASSSRIVVSSEDIDLAVITSPGTFKSVTVDMFGRVTTGTNPTTLSGFGITDAYTQTQVNTMVNAKLSLAGGTMTGAINMGGSSKIIGLIDPTSAGDAANKYYVDTQDALKLSLTGGTMSGAIAMGTNKITGLGDPTNPQDAATKNYIDTIFGSTTSAAASATAAANSASAAATSATNAATSATNAATSATNAATTYTNFNNQYLGSKTSDPSTNNTGGALVTGNLYWNSTTNEMRVYTGSAWLVAYLPATGYMDLSTNQTAAGIKTFSSNPVLSAGTANGVAYLNGSKSLTTGAGLQFDGSNLGLGLTPNAWQGSAKALEMSAGALMSYSTTSMSLMQNAYLNSSLNYIYKTTAAAAQYVVASGSHKWQVAPSGSAGAAIAFTDAMVVDNSGNLVVGASTAKARLQVSAASAQNSPTLGTAQGILYLSNNDPAYGLCIGNSSATGVAWFQAQRTDGTATAYDLVFNPAGGNVGVGVTPNAWSSSYKAVEMNSGALSSFGTSVFYMTQNAYYSTTGFKYKATGSATNYVQFDGVHRWQIAAAGTGGADCTFADAMVLSNAGVLSLQSILEKATVSATAATGTIPFNAATQPVVYYTANASSNWGVNVRGNATLTLNDMMANGQSLTVAFLVTQGATAYYPTIFQIDGTSVTPKWQGGTTPAAGNANSIDVYTYTIIKTATNTYTVLAAQTKFA